MDIREIDNEIPNIYKKFNGMNDMYVKLVRLYHDIAKTDKYAAGYINKCRFNTLEAITNLKREYVGSAIKVIQEIKEKYGEQPPAVEEPKTDQAKLLKELQRSNNLNLWSQQMRVASLEELRAMHKENKWDKDFCTLLDVTLRQRSKSEPAAVALKLEIDNPPANPAFKALDKIETGLKSLIKMNYYPRAWLKTAWMT